ncbi:hypothetical protein PG993_014017 [Apiospora rasikravindrae]|uniref:DUF7730 domain-containing protein n=1 Tax=Apiospora rasikravindrae TaxID=990691 RepID=A0ABR1RSZ0_9PEZI
MNQPHEQQPTFLGLPREIRDRIYEYLFVQPKDIDCYRVWFTTSGRLRRQLAREGADPDCCGWRDYGCGAHYEARLRPHGTALLRTCRRVHDEGTEVLYALNVFAVALEQRCVFLRLFNVGERNLRLVRHVKLTAYTDYHGYYITRDPDDSRPRGDGHWGERPWEFFGGAPAIGDDGARAAGWRALMGGDLKTLQLALLAPHWGHHRGWPVWVSQLEHVLGVVGDAVPEDADVAVDDNRSLFLCDAVDRCFSSRKKGFRRASLPEGDAHYRGKVRFDPDDVDGAPLNCDGDPVPKEVLKRLPNHPTEALPFVLFGEEHDDSNR